MNLIEHSMSVVLHFVITGKETGRRQVTLPPPSPRPPGSHMWSFRLYAFIRGRRGKVSQFLVKPQYLQNKWSHSAEILHLYSLGS